MTDRSLAAADGTRPSGGSAAGDERWQAHARRSFEAQDVALDLLLQARHGGNPGGFAGRPGRQRRGLARALREARRG